LSALKKNCAEILKDNDAQARIDEFDAVIVDARLRRRASAPVPPDAWREDLTPRQAVRARTVPLLEQERDRLKGYLAQVCRPWMRWRTVADDMRTQLTEENTRRMKGVEKTQKEGTNAEADLEAVLAENDEVRLAFGRVRVHVEIFGGGPDVRTMG
jgi:hypothetical protein